MAVEVTAVGATAAATVVEVMEVEVTVVGRTAGVTGVEARAGSASEVAVVTAVVTATVVVVAVVVVTEQLMNWRLRRW